MKKKQFPLDAKLGYNCGMTAKLTKELTAALHATGESGLEVVDDDTVYVWTVCRSAPDVLRPSNIALPPFA